MAKAILSITHPSNSKGFRAMLYAMSPLPSVAGPGPGIDGLTWSRWFERSGTWFLCHIDQACTGGGND
ncbi:hypothetical protein N7527_007853 [Penicillium freii]|nr:hypothetical protein N7527_007853 [Penicillium freii]